MRPHGPIEARAPFVMLIEQWQTAVRLQARRLLERDVVLEKSEDRLFESETQEFPYEWIEGRAQRMADTHFLVLSLVHLVKAVRYAAERDPESNIGELLGRFTADFPKWQAIRNAFEHMIEYIEGEGRLQKRGRMGQNPFAAVVDQLRSGRESSELEITGNLSIIRSRKSSGEALPQLYLNVGGVEIEMVAAVQAADELADGAVRALMHSPLPREPWHI